MEKKKYFVYFNPFTWIFICVSPPVFMVIQCCMKNPNSDIEELKKAGVIDFKSEDSDDSNFDDHGLEGFADMKDDKDENIFEIYDRLTMKDKMQKTKTFRQSVIIKYMKKNNNDAPPDINQSSLSRD